MREGNNFNLPHTPKGELGMRGLIRLVRTKPAQILFVSGLVILVLFLLIISIILNSFHAPNYISAATSPDAIAIRVIPNPDHYSPLHWYQNQGFTGSPQSLTVDGYEAVRDGRTVYVNAANVDATNLYTNIYLISYNQDAESATVDIFGRILEHWKFNTNVAGTGYCSKSDIQTDCTGTIGCWPLNGDFKDYSGNNNNGAEQGGVVFNSGVVNKAAYFDGSDDYVDLGPNFKFSRKDSFSVKTWVKPETGGGIIGAQRNGGDGGWNLIINNDGKIRVILVGGVDLIPGVTDYFIGANTNNKISFNEWHYIAFTFKGSNQDINGQDAVKIYVDGNLQAHNGSQIWDKNSDTLDFTLLNALIGKNRENRYFKGFIDELRIYNKTLTESEIIQDNYSQCLSDSECSSGGYCSSPKANIVRDTKRLSELVEVKLKLAEFKQANNHYPKLDSGTYLTNKTISVWPSWQETLAQELGVALPLDPINKLGACPGYDAITCWDEQTKKFAGSLPDNLPAGSNVMIYTATSTGASYDICAVMESGYLTGMAQGACPTSYVNISQTAFNNPPLITGVNLPIGYSGELYNGYIEASDPDGDKISWTLDTSLESWNFWSAAPALKDSGATKQRKITAANAGMPGLYDFNITLDDGRGGIVSQTYTITVKQSPNPPVVDPIADKTVTIGKNLSFAITASDPNNQYPLSFIFNDEPGGFASTGSVSLNQHDFDVSGIVVDQTETYNVSVVAANKYGNPSNPVAFTVTVENQAPQITSISLNNATACVNYNYTIATSDPDGHSVNDFSAAGLPANLTINNSTGLISGQPQTTGAFNITITARDEYAAQTILPYSAQDSQNYTLTVVDEVFSVNPLGNATIYVAPIGVPLSDLYHLPVTYFGTAGVTTSNPVTYSLSSNPAWLIIDANNGQMNGTPEDNVTDPGVYTITVAAQNNCGASYSANLNLTVFKNEWCGDTVTQAVEGEQCDDGDANNNDGCKNDCTNAVCGDIIVQTGVEECDDGNGIDTDNCTNACKNAVCGDGIVQVGVEQCDDNNTNNNDGCSSTCAVESGWNCVGSPSVCNTICGDWLIRGSEQCDDGNTINTDDCTNSCKNAVCGDGIIRSGIEQCDDGANNNSEGYCNSTCTGPQPPDSYGAWFHWTLACEADNCDSSPSSAYTCPIGVTKTCLDVLGPCGKCSDPGGQCSARNITCYP